MKRSPELTNVVDEKLEDNEIDVDLLSVSLYSDVFILDSACSTVWPPNNGAPWTWSA